MKTITLYERMGGAPALTKLLRHFYADVRQDPLIGPIFNAVIEDWPTHLEVIGTFWTTVTGGPPTYARSMPARHIPLSLELQHFERWLHLWGANCRAQQPGETGIELTALAHHVGGRLKQILGILEVQPVDV